MVKTTIAYICDRYADFNAEQSDRITRRRAGFVSRMYESC